MASGANARANNIHAQGSEIKDRLQMRHEKSRKVHDGDSSQNNKYYGKESQQRNDQSMSGTHGKKNIVEVLDYDSEDYMNRNNGDFNKNAKDKDFNGQKDQLNIQQALL